MTLVIWKSWGKLLISLAWAICSTHQTAPGANPGQIVLDRDMLKNIISMVD